MLVGIENTKLSDLSYIFVFIGKMREIGSKYIHIIHILLILCVFIFSTANSDHIFSLPEIYWVGKRSVRLSVAEFIGIKEAGELIAVLGTAAGKIEHQNLKRRDEWPSFRLFYFTYRYGIYFTLARNSQSDKIIQNIQINYTKYDYSSLQL